MSKIRQMPRCRKFWIMGPYDCYNPDCPDELAESMKETIDNLYLSDDIGIIENDAKISWKNITEIGLDKETIIEYLTINNITIFNDNIVCYGFLVEKLSKFDYGSNMHLIFEHSDDAFSDYRVCSINWVMEPEPILLVCATMKS